MHQQKKKAYNSSDKPCFTNTKSKFFKKKKSTTQKQESQQHNNMTGSQWKEKGNHFFKQSDYDKAIDCYSKAIDTYPGQSIYFSNRSKCYWKKNDLSKSLQDGQTACELDPDNFKAHYICGCIYAELGKSDYSKLLKAQNQLTKALRITRSKNKSQDEQFISIKIFRLKKLIWFKNKQKEQVNLQLQKKLLIQSKNNKLDQKKDYENAIQNIEKRLKQMNKPRQIPDCFICKITFCIMQDPVVSQSGFSYQRKALQQHYQERGCIEPITRYQNRGLIIPNIGLKQAIHDFLQQNPWAFEQESKQDYRNIIFN